MVVALDTLVARARAHVRPLVCDDGRLSRDRLRQRQLSAHALAHLATDAEAVRQSVRWASALSTRDGGGIADRVATAFASEVCASLYGGVALGACDTSRLEEIGLTTGAIDEALATHGAADAMCRHASGDALVQLAIELAKRASAGTVQDADDASGALRAHFRRFAEREIAPIAQRIHRNDELIPDELIAKLAAMGVFGLALPERYGGGGASMADMCVVTEEISRASLGVGSLATRSEIAGELILGAGTDAQRDEWLPGIVSGRVLPTAVFSEPNHGSDLANVATRAERQPGGGWKLYGQKTWITHATRADLMTVLARTRPDVAGYAGLSMFLARKSRGREGCEFPDVGLAGTEIKVIGYRGMKEYELSFDGFAVEASGLLGGVEGEGFKQLMQTFERARIQTAARSVGVAQAALDESVRHASTRTQFGQRLIEFPRVARKIGGMILRTAAARALTRHAAHARDAGRRCDLEAGMAKLFATRAAWEAADACVQIHGGMGYAEESVASRLLVDARVLSIFEGANEVQADVIARRLLEAE